VARTRWGDDAPADGEEARARLVDAAEACIDRKGLAKTTLEDVARQAKVSRATVYRYVDNRDELMLAVLLRDLDRSIETPLADFVAGADTPEAYATALADTAAYLLHTIRSSPRLRQLLQREGQGLSATIAGASDALFHEHADDLRPRLEDARRRGLVRDDLDADELAEWILRAILSLLTVAGPVARGPDEERRYLRALLGPALVPTAAAVPG
jgi:AcrR family transcriptional regulator